LFVENKLGTLQQEAIIAVIFYQIELFFVGVCKALTAMCCNTFKNHG